MIGIKGQERGSGSSSGINPVLQISLHAQQDVKQRTLAQGR